MKKRGDVYNVLEAHNILNAAYKTDVCLLLAQVREEMGVPADPLATYKASGYEETSAESAASMRPAAASSRGRTR